MDHGVHLLVDSSALTGPNCSKYDLTSAAVVVADRPPTNIFFVRVTSYMHTSTQSHFLPSFTRSTSTQWRALIFQTKH